MFETRQAAVTMIEQERWLKQQIDLLRLQLQEWKDDLDEERKCRDSIIDQHHQEQARLVGKAHILEWSNHLVLYTSELYKLIDASTLRRKIMKWRHKQQTATLDKQIKQEQLKPKKH